MMAIQNQVVVQKSDTDLLSTTVLAQYYLKGFVTIYVSKVLYVSPNAYATNIKNKDS